MYIEGKRLLLMHQLNILVENHGGMNNFTNLLDRISKADEDELDKIGQKMFEEKEITDDNGKEVDVDLTDTYCILKDGKIDFPNYCNALGNILFNETNRPDCISPITYKRFARTPNNYFLPLFIFSRTIYSIQPIGCKEGTKEAIDYESLQNLEITKTPDISGLHEIIRAQITKVLKIQQSLYHDLSTKGMSPERKRQIINGIINGALFFVSALGVCTSLMIFKPDIFSGIDIVFPNLPNFATGIVGAISIAITISSFVPALLRSRSAFINSHQNKMILGAHPNLNESLTNTNRYANKDIDKSLKQDPWQDWRDSSGISIPFDN
jgi:hypothetical protein